MKLHKCFILLYCFILINQVLYAEFNPGMTNSFNEYQEQSNFEDRIYLDKDSIVLSDQGLFFISESQTIPLPCLHAEGNHFYITTNDFLVFFGQWRCFNCGEINSESVAKCWRCGKSK
jgi:hypothetical protein